jgi:hypothetical protein
VPASSLCNSIGEEEEHGSEKCEGSPSLGVVSTPLQVHNLKGAPRKCRALRRVVCPFEYEESWKGLMPPNGGVPEKERYWFLLFLVRENREFVLFGGALF